ncbi:MAG: S8 family serine peptidase [Sphaerobacter sp.]|nr:S8 family serine peptidase [Sphaerobacter sp.]
MRTTSLRLLLTLALLLVTLVPMSAVAAASAPAPADANTLTRYLVETKQAPATTAVQAAVANLGGTVVDEIPALNLLVVRAPSQVKQQLQANPLVSRVAVDRIERIVPAELAPSSTAGPRVVAPRRINLDAALQGSAAAPERASALQAPAITPDPASALPGLLWNLARVKTAEAWVTTAGEPAVTVGVADTGIDFTHAELADTVVEVVDLTVNEDPPVCQAYFGVSDEDLAEQYNGPAETDWNGHGTWIGGNIAAAHDGQGINGIAPGVRLVSLKISQWCGFAYDSTILEAFVYAADNGIDVVSISFGGYVDLADPEQQLIYDQFVEAVQYAQDNGTTIVAAAGNEHVRLDADGKVVSHGTLTSPGAGPGQASDLFGLYEVPGGVPGVVSVGSTGNRVNAAVESCPDGTADGSDATCKPASASHQPFGVDQENQLAYYSNYGPGVDLVAPGGARKFNLPTWDGGGTAGFPYTEADQFNTWEAFSTTSNWATFTGQIPCFQFEGGGFPANQCYTSIQGTSMATPHVSAVLALAASTNENLRGDSVALVELVKASAQKITGNATPTLSETDTSPGDQGGASCDSGYCHLGGSPIPDEEAYGAGLVDAEAAVVAASAVGAGQ